MHFELRWYADGASNLLIEVWDSSADYLYLYRNEHRLYKIDFFSMFSCILSFVDMPMVLPTY